jgi:tetratricopeptide (TPR) repeat protein
MRKNVIRSSVSPLVCFILVAGVFAQGQSDTDSLYSKAYALFQSGKYDESIKVFSDFLDLNPKSPLYPSALFWQSESYHLINDTVSAYKGFMRLIAEFPSSDKVDLAVRKLGSLSAEDSGARLTRLLGFAGGGMRNATRMTKKLRSMWSGISNALKISWACFECNMV